MIGHFKKTGRRVTARDYFTVALLGLLVAFLLLPSSKAVNNYYYVLVGLPGLMCMVLGKAPARPMTPLLMCWLALAGWLFLSILTGEDYRYFKYWLYLTVFCATVFFWVNPAPFRTHRFAVWAFVALALYVCASALYIWTMNQRPVGVRIVDLPLRLSGPILTSMLLVSLLALVLPGWVQRRRWLLISLAFVVTCFCVGYVLQSRSGLVGIASVLLGLLAYLCFMRHTLVLRGLSVLFILVAVVIAVGFHDDVTTLQRLIARGDSGRFELWREFVLALRDCGLVFGCGPGYSGSVHIYSGRILIEHPHNIGLTAAFYHGLPALLLLAAALGLTLYQAWRMRNPWGWYLLVALLMLMFDGGKLVDSPDEIWLLIFLPSMLIVADVCQPKVNIRERDSRVMA